MPGWDRPRKVAFTAADKRTILKRDRWCAMCRERPSTQADHIKPIAEGGANTATNGQGLCDGCHETKSLNEARRGYKRWNDRDRPRQRRAPEKHPGIVN